MVRLFLSYAHKDGGTARELTDRLRREGFEVFSWQEERGERFVERIQKEISQADAFLALLSPSFLASSWCRKETALALQRDMDREASHPDNPTLPFVIVLEIVETPPAGAGFLRSYDWFDLTTERMREQELPLLIGRLAKQGEPGSARPAMLFRNRSQELELLMPALANPSGQHFWLVVAPPQLGKTWFLGRLNKAMAAAPHNWITASIDVSEAPLGMRVDAARLLAGFFGLGSLTSITPQTLLDIAATISRGRRPYLCLLDSANLLDKSVAAELRSHLSRIYQLLPEAGNIDVRLAFVAASRRQREWKGVAQGLRISQLPLTHFSVNVVEQALRDRAGGRSFSDSWYRENAARVHRLSEGLPALLVRCLQWIEAAEFLKMGRLDTHDVFEKLAHPYIRDGLLSVESLLPSGGDQLRERRNALEQVFRVLAPYRLFTQSHLRYHLESDRDLKAALGELGWATDQLWAAISDTALLSQPLGEPWQEIYPAIRRLLYRYYYQSDKQQADAHLAARKFYEAWWGEPAGKEQSVVLVELLWHEAARVRLDPSTELEQALVQYAGDLYQTVKAPRAYSKQELLDYTVDRMGDDEEFQEAVGHLFDRLVRIIERGPEES